MLLLILQFILNVSKDDRFKYLLNSNDLEQILVNFGTEISKRNRWIW